MSKTLAELAMEYALLVPGPIGYPKGMSLEDKLKAKDLWHQIEAEADTFSHAIAAVDAARATLKLVDPSIRLIGEMRGWG